MKNRVKDLKIFFLGTPEIAATILDFLITSDYPINTVITRPDRPQGRHKELIPSPVKAKSEIIGLPIFQPENKLELEKYIVSEKPDLILVCAYGMILTEKTLSAVRIGAINVHPSLLPKYRGPSPIAAPILAGDQNTGTTIMLMSVGMDEGDILSQTELPLTGDETTESLTKNLADLSAKLLSDTIPKYLEKKIIPQKQDESLVSYTKMAKKEDGLIHWDRETAAEIERKSRAYTPWPGSYTTYQGKKIDLYGITITERLLKPGEIRAENQSLLIGTKDRAIKVSEVKLEGKTKIAASDFIKGYPDLSDVTLGS